MPIRSGVLRGQLDGEAVGGQSAEGREKTTHIPPTSSGSSGGSLRLWGPPAVGRARVRAREPVIVLVVVGRAPARKRQACS